MDQILSYKLANRRLNLVIGFQTPSHPPYSTPGPVLGPFLFILYTTPLGNIIFSLNVNHHLYADDAQIYLALDHRNFDSSVFELTECLTCVQKLMDGVKMKLNPERTEFIIIGDRQFPHGKISDPTFWKLYLPYQYSQELRCYFRLWKQLYQSHNQGRSCPLLSPQGPTMHPEIPQCRDCSPACKLNN